MLRQGPYRSHVSAVLLVGLAVAFAACTSAPDEVEIDSPARAGGIDPHSYSRPAEVVVRHLALDLTADFEERRLHGRASFKVENLSGAEELILDSRDLEIHRVRLDPGDLEAEFVLSDPEPFLGRKLSIALPERVETIHIDYSTSPEAMALQWLEPSQTQGDLPFLYSQSQPNLARSWVPCQDSPGVRMTYEATIRVPIGMMAVMSATNPTSVAGDGIYTFDMRQPVPCYLMAIAIGELEFRDLGPRTGVYAEPLVVDSAAWEFADVEMMMEAAERLYGPYRWDRYDILVLPPSFPFGGMENPRLTFATPTIIAGDRSLVSLVAHELAHSWSGNLVTNATWNDTWLNEGFTTYFESRIMEEIFGREFSEMLSVLDYQGLLESLETTEGEEPPQSRLHLDLTASDDPDLASGTAAYVKGALFLRWLEEQIGRERFDALIANWFDENAFQSQDADGFVAFLHRELELSGDDPLVRFVDEWIFQPGLPADHPVPDSPRLDDVRRQLQTWSDGRDAAALSTGAWSTQEFLYFLGNQPDDLSVDDLEDLDGALDLTGTGNDRILSLWLELAVRFGYRNADAALEEFLNRVGRRWLVEGIYRELAAQPEGRERALEIYSHARDGYHGILRATIDALLDPESEGAS